jgi:branched-chain amino acid transport system substrate-binding protein
LWCKARFGPINNCVASSYDSARIVMSAIEAAAKAKGGLPDRADVLAALKVVKFQGDAYAAPEAFDAKGDNIAAVIFVNDVGGGRFRGEIDRIGGGR